MKTLMKAMLRVTKVTVADETRPMTSNVSTLLKKSIATQAVRCSKLGGST